MGTPPAAPKVKALRDGDPVAVTIDSGDWPYQVLYVRGNAAITTRTGVVAEYALAAVKYLGAEQGAAWVAQFPLDVRVTPGSRCAPTGSAFWTSGIASRAPCKSERPAVEGRSADLNCYR